MIKVWIFVSEKNELYLQTSNSLCSWKFLFYSQHFFIYLFISNLNTERKKVYLSWLADTHLPRILTVKLSSPADFCAIFFSLARTFCFWIRSCSSIFFPVSVKVTSVLFFSLFFSAVGYWIQKIRWWEVYVNNRVVPTHYTESGGTKKKVRSNKH